MAAVVAPDNINNKELSSMNSFLYRELISPIRQISTNKLKNELISWTIAKNRNNGNSYKTHLQCKRSISI